MSSASPLAGGHLDPNGGAIQPIARQQAAPKRPLFRAKDFVILPAIGGGMILFGALARPICTRLARMMAGARATIFAKELKTARPDWLDGIDASANAVLRSHFEERSVASALFLRSLVRGSAYEVELQGGEAIDAALARGKGVVLWVSDFLYARDVVKIALSQAGYAASHLSQPEHGFSDSRFGIRVLNPIRTGFESRYLRERIVYDRSDPGRAVQRLMQRLAENGIVSITATAAEGRNLYEAAFLNGRLRLAPGAPKLGYRSGAPVLPVFIVPNAEAPRFRVVVESPLNAAGAAEAEAIEAAVRDYVGRLESYVRRWPQLWAGWDVA